MSSVNMIEFKDVSFGYDSDPLILRKVSFSIRPGEKVALVGANGSGKSTLAKLLCRFYEPQAGQILVNGIDLRELDISQWRDKLSAVFRTLANILFHFGENVGFADVHRSLDQNRLHAAIVSGGIDYLLGHLPQGLDTLLGKEFSGKELSFGEWQKLAIARLLFRNSEIIVMDEPTASLDPESEYEVFQRLIQMFESKAVLLITHRLSSVKMCDKILVLENGMVVEAGTHAALMEQNGRYHHMFSLQASGYQTDSIAPRGVLQADYT